MPSASAPASIEEVSVSKAEGLRRPRVVVVGLGPAGPEFLSAGVLDLLASASHSFVRTERHPAVAAVREAVGPSLGTFDHCYEAADSFEQVYAAIVEELILAAQAAAKESAPNSPASAFQGPSKSKQVVYAVPGSPLVAERTVELLRSDDRVDVEVIPALSFLDLAWERLGVDPLAAGVRLVDATTFAIEAAGERGPMLVAQCYNQGLLSDMKLMIDESTFSSEGGPLGAVLLYHLGMPDELVLEVAWEDLDRTIQADHLTSVWVPRLPARIAGEFVRLEELMRTLRVQCPWDSGQTHESLARHLLEETYEALEAIAAVSCVDPDDVEPRAIEHLQEELGDVLFQVVFHAALAGEVGWFTLADVARMVHDKLVYRHPHVFGDVKADTPQEVAANWEVLKEREKGRRSPTEGIPEALPALSMAAKLRRAALKSGVPLPSSTAAGEAVIRMVNDLLAEPSIVEPAGELLFILAGMLQELGVDTETALLAEAARFRQQLTTSG